MSTKAIREALSEYLMLADADPRGASPRERGVHAAALAEVEAIERAATWMYEITDTSKVPHEEYERCCKVLFAIYEQAKAR